MGNALTVMFGSAKKSVKAQKPNPSTDKVVMSPAPSIGAPIDEYKEPTHEERLHRAAAHGHVDAAHDYVAGRISKAQYEDRKRRAESIMGKTPKAKT